jgi:choline dehydrogenase-like flavoprotein
MSAHGNARAPDTPEPRIAPDEFDAIVIGSGFGGTMCAQRLVHAGWNVLMIERGDWVQRGPRNWDADRAMDLAPEYTHGAYDLRGDDTGTAGVFHCVGGPSVFYGAASLRYRERDFEHDPAIVRDSGARWPVDYATMEKWYGHAERLLGVAGNETGDPTAPGRSTPLLPEPPLPAPSQRIAESARGLGFSPSSLPLAINWQGTAKRAPCVACTTCDAYACAIGAKNDLASAVLPRLLERGLAIATNLTARRLVVTGTTITAVDCVDTRSGLTRTFRARHFVLAAGALASAHLVLASGLDRLSPARPHVGRYLMRHCNGMVFGYFPEPLDRERVFHKRLALFDAYFGHASVRAPAGKLGCIQQIHAPPVGVARSRVPAWMQGIVPPVVSHLGGLLVIAEDQPLQTNGVHIDEGRRDVHGMPRAVITHRYTRRDRAARRALASIASSVLRHAGARVAGLVPIRTFSHAVGTLRMGTDPETAPVDAEGRFRGIDNLHVTDGSVLPTSAGVNPSLTIAANALRIGDRMTGSCGLDAVDDVSIQSSAWSDPPRLVQLEGRHLAPATALMRVAGSR